MPRTGLGNIILTGEDVILSAAGGVSLPAMFYPAGRTDGPVMILCPGGVGTGMLEMAEWIAAPLREAGISALTIGWRSGHPSSDPDDIAAAIDWLAARPEIDAARIGIMGSSRGGNAALRAAAVDARLKAVVVFGPVTDLLQQAETVRDYAPTRYHMFVDWLGDPAEKREDYRQLSAITHAAGIRQPVLMVHGQHDMHAPPEQSIWMKEAIERGGNTDVHLEIMPMMGHYGDTIPNGYGFDRLTAVILPFVEQRL